jgi:LytS/YehU family sensor histidine kinase
MPVLLEATYAYGIVYSIKVIVIAFLMLYVFLLSETKRLIVHNRLYVYELLSEANAHYAEYAYNALKSRSVVSFLQRALQDAKKLIAISEERSITYIGNLTKILRYLLQSRNETLVSAFEESQMVLELAALHKTQSGIDMEIILDVPEQKEGLLVPPFVLQMIVDNILVNKSLIGRSVLEIYVENGIYLVVKFSGTNQKHANADEFKQLIEDLQHRYEILDQRSEVITIFSAKQNYVKLPLIEA